LPRFDVLHGLKTKGGSEVESTTFKTENIFYVYKKDMNSTFKVDLLLDFSIDLATLEHEQNTSAVKAKPVVLVGKKNCRRNMTKI